MKKVIVYVLGIIFGAYISVVLLHDYNNFSFFYFLDGSQIEEESFRCMDFTDNGLLQMRTFADCYELDIYDVITTWMISDGYHWKKRDINEATRKWYERQKQQMLHYNKYAFLKLRNAYETLLSGISCFPVPKSTNMNVSFVTYEQSWGDKRTYGGERTHEGTDVMGMEYPRGFYPVISITDGIVENIGWLEKGGHRIGIRTEKGGYFYYAHLYSYSDGLQVGSKVKAGDIIGFMGDSGYGMEGTIGKFPVHLHFGMYMQTAHLEEMSVNPYYILKYLEHFVRVYDY